MEGNNYSNIEPSYSSIPSKRQFFIRVIVSLAIIGICSFTLVAIGIIEIIGIINLPRQNPYFTLTNLQLKKFEMTNFCPSVNDTSCCVGNICTFNYSNYNLTMESDYIIQNPNYGVYFNWEDLVVQIRYKDAIIGIGKTLNQTQNPVTTVENKLEAVFNLNYTMMNFLLCEMDKNKKISFKQTLNFVKPKLNNDTIELGSITTENEVDFGNLCSKALHQCRFNPNFRNQTCLN